MNNEARYTTEALGLQENFKRLQKLDVNSTERLLQLVVDLAVEIDIARIERRRHLEGQT